MDFIKNNWVLLLILIVLAFLVYRYYKKNKSLPLVKNTTQSTNSSVNQIKNSVSSNTGNVNVVTNQQISSPQIELNIANWKIGDKIYAGPNGVNTYTSPAISVNNISKHYNKDEYIGTFLANENGFAKMVVEVKANSLQSVFGYTSNQVVYSIGKQVYSK